MGFAVGVSTAFAARSTARRALRGAKGIKPSGLIPFALLDARSRQIMSQPLSPASTKRKENRSIPLGWTVLLSLVSMLGVQRAFLYQTSVNTPTSRQSDSEVVESGAECWSGGIQLHSQKSHSTSSVSYLPQSIWPQIFCLDILFLPSHQGGIHSDPYFIHIILNRVIQAYSAAYLIIGVVSLPNDPDAGRTTQHGNVVFVVLSESRCAVIRHINHREAVYCFFFR